MNFHYATLVNPESSSYHTVTTRTPPTAIVPALGVNVISSAEPDTIATAEFWSNKAEPLEFLAARGSATVSAEVAQVKAADAPPPANARAVLTIAEAPIILAPTGT